MTTVNSLAKLRTAHVRGEGRVEYEFTFVVEGATVADSAVTDALEEAFDAMLYRGGGVDLLDVAAEGADALDAAINAAKSLSSLVPQLRLLYLDRDLVGITEIARRSGVTRQNVHQWITGARHAGRPFPRPEGTTGRTQVWLWSEVNRWLSALGLDDGLHRPNRFEMADIDVALQAALDRKTVGTIERWRRVRQMGVLGEPFAEPSWKPVLRELASTSGRTGRTLTTKNAGIGEQLTVHPSAAYVAHSSAGSTNVVVEVP